MGSATKASFVRFVYPFVFDPTRFENLVELTNRAYWGDENNPHYIWGHLNFPEEDLLPHVARFLNGGNRKDSDCQEATAHLWMIQDPALKSINWGMGAQAEWEVHLSKDEIIKIEWTSVELVLFRLGTGFLTIEVRPHSDDPDIWLDFIHRFRFIVGKRAPYLTARNKIGKDEWSFFVPCTISCLAEYSDGKIYLDQVIKTLLSSVQNDGNIDKNWWHDVFIPDQLIPFVCLMIEGASEDLGEQAKYLFKARSLYHSNQANNPCDEDLKIDHSSLLAYASRQWFFFTLDGAGFVSFNAPKNEFNNTTLPDHIRKQYFLLFLISTNQRFTLANIQEQVAKRWLNTAKGEKACVFERVYEELLEFDARIYFAQVMQREHHHRCYRKCQEIFQIPQLHNELSDEVQRMYERVSFDRAEQMQRKIDLLTFMIGVPALIFSFLSVPWLELQIPFPVRIFMLFALISLGGLAVYLLRGSWRHQRRFRRDLDISLRRRRPNRNRI
ncbi:MAG: hypothetical protein ABSF88_09220 [Candidatus Aminicenantales bacterium]